MLAVPNRVLELREHQLEQEVPLTAEETDMLRTGLSSLAVSPSTGRPGRYDLRPGSTVGTVDLGAGLHVRIRPKLPIGRVLFLLAYSADPKLWHRRSAPFGEHDDLVEAVAVGFVHQVRHVIRQGLLQGYRTREESMAGLRGRLRFEDQLRRRYGRFPPAEVRYDDFTVDIDENRLLLAAARRLGQLGIRSGETRRALRALADALADVSLVRYTRSSLPEVTYTRLNERYRPAVELGIRILQATSFDLEGRGLTARGFLVDMNALFEDFVSTALREELGLSPKSFPRTSRGHRLTLDEAGRIGLEPDISWWSGGRCLFVGDVKYKRSSGGLGKHPDYYQLLSYLAATGLPEGMLIYAAGEAEPGVYRVRHLGKRLEVVALDLSARPQDVMAQIRGLAARIADSAHERNLSR